MPKTSISFITLGCSKNQVDTEFIASGIESNSTTISHEREYADIIIINTCGFILDAKEQSIEVILKYTKAKKEGKINKLIVFGCLVERYKDDLKNEISEVDKWFGVHENNKLIKYINNKAELPKTRKIELLTTPKHYAYLKIAEGCDRHCSFCAIPSIRGKHISKPIEEIILEAKHLVNSGVKELIIISQDTTYYGIDIYGKQMISELIEKIALESGAEWIRLHYAYPSNFPSELINIMSKYSNICKYIDIPFQHVNDSILNAMKRFHNKNDIVNIISNFRNKIPDIAIRTTFMIGFPNESRKEYNELVDFIKKVKFERLGVFAYSEEENTTAQNLEDNVTHRTKIKRMETLMSVQENISKKINSEKIGKTFKVIIDEVNENHILCRTEFDSPDVDNLVYVDIKKNHNFKQGQFINTKIIGADAYDLIGEV
jgi:ribosomal protein S12 methylthiotransferase